MVFQYGVELVRFLDSVDPGSDLLGIGQHYVSLPNLFRV